MQSSHWYVQAGMIPSGTLITSTLSPTAVKRSPFPCQWKMLTFMLMTLQSVIVLTAACSEKHAWFAAC